MNTENAKTNFRTAKDDERMKRAADVVATHAARVEAAQSAVAAAESECSDDPSEKNFANAKEKRRALEDAERDLALARQHEGKVSAEVAAAEHAAIRTVIARREAALTVVADDEARELAVELAVRSVELRRRTEARSAERHAELEELNALRSRVGEAKKVIPSISQIVGDAVIRIAEIGLSAQAQSGFRMADIEPFDVYKFLPIFKSGSTLNGEIAEYLTGTERFSVVGATGDGTPITHGVERRELVAEAKAILDRVKAKRLALESGKSGVAGIAKAAAAALGLIAVLSMVHG